MDAPPPRRLGPWMCAALVVGNMVGTGVFLLPASLAPYGGISILGWVFTTTGAILLALVFARLGRALPKVGGPYAYTHAAFGDFVGFLIAWGYWVSIWVGNAAIAVGFVGYLGFFLPPLSAGGFAAGTTALAAVWLLTAVNAAGIREAGIVQVVTAALKLVPLLAVGILGLAFFEPANFTPFNRAGGSAFTAVSASAALTLWAFSGLESATVPAEHVRRPDRTIARATIVGTLVAAAIYISATTAVMGIVPPAVLETSSAPFADAARSIWGSWAGYAVAAGAVISAFGALNGWILLQGQIPLAAARDGLFPAAFGRLSRAGTPAAALVGSSVLITLLVAANFTMGLVELFTFALLISTMSTLVPYLLSSLAALRLSAASGRAQVPHSRGFMAIAALAAIYSLWAIAGTGRDTIFWGLVLLLAGMPVYVWMRRRAPTTETA